MTRLGCELQWAVEIQEIQPSAFNTKNNKDKKKGEKRRFMGVLIKVLQRNRIYSIDR